MAVLKTTIKHKIYISSLMNSLLFGMIIFSGYIITLSSSLSNSNGNVNAKFGPVILFELYKNPNKGSGYSAGLNFKIGTIYYLLFWLVFSILIWVYKRSIKN